MTFALLTLLACFPEIKESEEGRFPENPTDDYDQDGFMDAEDCDDTNPLITLEVRYYADADGDGFGTESDSVLSCPADKPDGYIEEKTRNGQVVFDCDDEDDSVNPDAEEVCDFVDNDCDQDVDEDVSDAPLWFFDADDDGYGNFFQPEPGCPDEDGNGPIGYVGNYADCDDSNSDVYPNADEYCNEIDDNCNGIIDEALSVDALIWYADNDGDGFGLLSNAQPSCTQPEGFVGTEYGGDCNDEDPLIHPDALESCEAEGEIGVDEDCDGLVNEGSDSTAPIGSPTYYADTDGDGYGDPNATLIQCDIITGYVTNLDDCNDVDATLNPDTVWYQDSDGDGEGAQNNALLQCIQPTGYVPNFSDCNDSDVTLNTADADSDGFSTCDGDCDDTDVNANLSDADGDGMDSCSGDCNDGDATIYLNAQEYCNDIDDNCDGNIDEGLDSTAPMGSTIWYLDSDGDGDGDASQTLTQCVMPVTHVDNTDDCDDSDATLNADDADSDGFSTCDGDCDDTDISLNLSDSDGDGQNSCFGDCDDNDAAVYLNAPETCNSFDDDCDGNIDEEDAIDRTAWYADTDGDGEGDGGSVEFACDQPVGFVANLDDCVDTDAAINTSATEVCDTIDNNCDGQIDDADANVDLNTATEYFQDADFDGYGNPLQSTFSCLQVPGFVANPDDCDDSNLLRNPDGFEYCNNIDDNCDGTIDELAVDSTDYYVDADGDGHGSLVDVGTGYDLNSCPSFDPITNLPINPTGYASTNDDCEDGDAAISPSASELCSNGIDENCDGHNTAGATDVTTFLVDADRDTFGSGERDSNDELAYALDLCTQPYGYVPYLVGDSLDCDDGDSNVKPGATELCNGQLDNCASDGSTTVPSDEWDDDGDGRVECTLDVDPLQWADVTLGIVGGDDCDDNDIHAYPDAPELCNGAFEDCNDSLYIAQSQSAPDDEIDDDADCFVECYGFDANIWEGGVHSCEHVDGIGQIVQETVVIGGEDCNDDNPDTYVGAAYNDPTVCAQDADGDGDADCNLVGLVGLTTNYSCDFGVDLPNGGMGPDFVLIQGGLEPLGRYTLTNDFYVMTTEVTQQMWTDVMDGSGYWYTPSWNYVGMLYPAHYVSWYDATSFANRLSILTGREECYGNNDDVIIDPNQQFDPDDLDASFTSPYECNGFRLLTEAEWEYAARSGTTSDFWTGQGSELGGTVSSDTSYGTETIIDGVSNPLLRDYAWYRGNNNNQYGVQGPKQVGQKLPNGFGLYDVHGNLREWTEDWLYTCIYPESSLDPYCGAPGSGDRVTRGGHWNLLPNYVGVDGTRQNAYPSYRYDAAQLGFRLALTAQP